MKKNYKTALIEVIDVDDDDVIATSTAPGNVNGDPTNNGTPILGGRDPYA